MQPLAYFAVRSLLGWLQWVEQGDRAFVSNALLLVATGATHCWAVVYALFIAIHTRAMRYDGYHEGYAEHLPFWVSWTETLSIASMGIWWAAGFTTAAIRIVDDDARGLPMEIGEVTPNIFIQLIRSPKLHNGLAVAHTVSCVGLFASIILLCIAMALMAGSITACELCLCFVSVGFALPHAVVAGRRLSMQDNKKQDDIVEPAPAAEAAAQEAAALGPQLCVVLALADSPGHAYLWQNFIYLVSAIAYVAAVAACGRSPPKAGDSALPPETGEFVTCLLLDAAASISLVVCFPHLNTWHIWALAALLAALFVAIWFEGWRDLVVDLLDPLLVVRSDTDKALPGHQRQRLRHTAWALTLVCATVALWDILLHPVQEGLFEPMDDHLEDGFPDLWDANTMLLLRWKDTPVKPPGENELISAAAEGLGVEKERLKTQVLFEQHRLWLFKVEKDRETDANKLPAHISWKALMLAPKGRLTKYVDSEFPGALNVTLCLHAHATVELAKQKAVDKKVEEGLSKETAAEQIGAGEEIKPDMPADFVQIVGPAPDAQAAYLAGCDWWTDTLDLTYGGGMDDVHEAEANAADLHEAEAMLKADEGKADEVTVE